MFVVACACMYYMCRDTPAVIVTMSTTYSISLVLAITMLTWFVACDCLFSSELYSYLLLVNNEKVMVAAVGMMWGQLDSIVSEWSQHCTMITGMYTIAICAVLSWYIAPDCTLQ